MPNKPTGYSGTPLAKKLGITEGTRLLTQHAPENYAQILQPLPNGMCFEKKLSVNTNIVHLFTTRRDALQKELTVLRKTINKDAIVWVSWPKKASKVETDITEVVIREVALPMGFVDVKVCAVTDVWSGLKLCIRKELRK
jgi:hypothetical protein